MWAEALHALLTSLRCLAPAALLTFFWGQYHLAHKLLSNLHDALRSVLLSSDVQTESVLQWVSESGPEQVTSLQQVWRRGWIVCALVERALPGACGGHPRAPLSIEHAQILAAQYLGVQPVFSQHELESQEPLGKHQEWRLANYLDRLRHALSRICPQHVSKPNFPRIGRANPAYTLDYVAKGEGLCIAYTGKNMCFKIYPTSQQSMNPGEINVLIRGPNDTHGTVVIQPLYSRAQILRQAFLGLDVHMVCTERALPLTQGNTYLRFNGKTDFNKTFHIPKNAHDINIQVKVQRDHVRVTYSAETEGVYEITLTSHGYNLIGSPFRVVATEDNNECDTNTDLDEDEESGVVEVSNDRRIVFRIVDFVTEKMLLNEDGTLETISEEDAKKMICTTQTVHLNTSNRKDNYDQTSVLTKEANKQHKRFRNAANKIIKIIRVCHYFKTFIQEKETVYSEFYKNVGIPIDIPDIVHSMIFDKTRRYVEDSTIAYAGTLNNPIVTEKDDINLEDNHKLHNKISIKPPTDVAFDCCIEKDTENEQAMSAVTFPNTIFTEDSLNLQKTIVSEVANEQDASSDRQKLKRSFNSSNPFTNVSTIINTSSSDINTEIFGKNSINYDPFHKQRNDKDKYSVEDVNKIEKEIETEFKELAVSKSQFTNSMIERAKTPIMKILNLDNCNDPINTDFNSDATNNEHFRSNSISLDEKISNASHMVPTYTLPPVVEFLIGAPVSVTPIQNVPSPEPHINPIILASNPEKAFLNYDNKVQIIEENDGAYRCNSQEFVQKNCNYNKSDSTYTECNSAELITPATTCSEQLIQEGHKDLWDSAYVSIDEINSCPTDNKNHNEKNRIELFNDCEELCEYLNSPFLNVGPAEREIWQNCGYLKPDLRRYNSNMLSQESPENTELTPVLKLRKSANSFVPISFAKQEPDNNELPGPKEIYRDYQSLEVNFTMIHNEESVNSASENKADVKRHKMDENKVAISEVQTLANESFSVSRALDNIFSDSIQNGTNCKITTFCQNSGENLVTQKKRFWDEKIRLIEEINNLQQKNLKEARHTEHSNKIKDKILVNSVVKSDINHNSKVNIKNESEGTDNPKTNIKLVPKWKQYWDEKLFSPDKTKDFKSTGEMTNGKTNIKTKKIIVPTSYVESKHTLNEKQNATYEIVLHPEKHNVTEEKLFQAFETSPKRFFGRSRNNILDKIESFLEKTDTTEKLQNLDFGDCHNDGIVLSRISLFNIKTESVEPQKCNEVILAKISKQSCIGEKSLFDNNNEKAESKFPVERCNNLAECNDISQITSKPVEHMKQHKFKKISESKSELDIFNRIQKTTDREIHKSCEDLQRVNVRQFISIFETIPKTEMKQDVSRNIARSTNVKTNDFKGLTSPLFEYASPITGGPQRKKGDTYNKRVLKRANAIDNSNESIDKEIKLDCTVSESSEKYLQTKHDNNTIRETQSTYPKSKSEKYKQLQTKHNNYTDRLTQSTDTEPESEEYKQTLQNKHGNDTDRQIQSTDTEPEGEEYKQRLQTKHNNNTDRLTQSTDTEPESEEYKQTLQNKHNNDTDRQIQSTDTEPEGEEYKQRLQTKHNNNTDRLTQSTDTKPESVEYKQRFNSAKIFFQSLEELRIKKKNTPRLNECEVLLYCQSTESLLIQPTKSMTVESVSTPSLDSECRDNAKLVKISEKFQVDDLFNDVAGEGKLSRTGSFRGIPNKQAVLATFKSMDNVAGTLSYNMRESQLSGLMKENRAQAAQTYLTEYPYLPRTDPSQYRSRVDSEASGLISRREMLERYPRTRRNSVPDAVKLDSKFTATL